SPAPRPARAEAGGSMPQFTLDDLLRSMVANNASDLHLKAGMPAVLRIQGQITQIQMEPLSRDDISQMVTAPLTATQIEKLHNERELDFSYQLAEVARFRGNLFWQKGNLGAVFRIIPSEVPSLETLGMPPLLAQLTEREQGLVLVTGPTGSGKSTTLAAMIDYLNATQPRHIITIEDPLEFVHGDKVALVNQREVGADTKSFSEALRRALRQDPDVILVGEMRDPETIDIAMTAAETGHLVFSTLHTNDAKQSIDRIINAFPPEEHHQVRMQLALVLTAVVSQRLVRKVDGSGRVAVQEIMINSPTVRKLVEEGKTQSLDKVIEESNDYYGMQSLNQALAAAVRSGVVSEEGAVAVSNNPGDLKMKLQTERLSAAAAAVDPQEVARKQGLVKSSLESRYDGAQHTSQGSPKGHPYGA
ncbi:MAG: type IV pilus twitching motility protein PilT, partial [Candidatus Xenobia bacterium]